MRGQNSLVTPEKFLKPSRFLVLLGLGFLLSACGSSTGDFGRPQTGYATSAYWPILATAAKAWRDDPDSTGPTTDDERELRNRAWHFLMPQFPQNKFDDMLAEMRVESILPPVTGTDREIYLNMLLSGDPFRSLASRYRRLAEDIEADRALIISFEQNWALVKEGDRIRERSFSHVHDLTQSERNDALARIHENLNLHRWVYRDLCYRVDMYRYALERLVIMGPMREAIYAERGLAALALHCAPPAAISSPIQRRALVRKG